MSLKLFDPEKEYSEVTEELYGYVITRDGGLCQVCGKSGDHLHHVKFRSRLGKHKANNLILLCMNCHTGYKGIHGTMRDVSKMLFERIRQNEKLLRRRLA